MAVYLDTSAFVKLVVKEPYTQDLCTWLRARDVHVVASELLRTEGLRAARRHSVAAVGKMRTALEAVELVAVSTDVCERAAELDVRIPRSLDAIHVATALTVGDRLDAVVTYDSRLAEACQSYGLRVESPSA